MIIYVKTSEIPVESIKQVKMAFFPINANLTDFFGQIVSTLKVSHCIFDIHPHLDSNSDSFKLKTSISIFQLIFKPLF